jgi:hypothetical protein
MIHGVRFPSSVLSSIPVILST